MPFQKTFDQMLTQTPGIDPLSSPESIIPNVAIPATVVFEPMTAQGHVRITARSRDFRLLWGVVASPNTLRRHPVEVAFYDMMLTEAEKHLPQTKSPPERNAIETALDLLALMKSRIEQIEKSLKPKKVTEQTLERASKLLPDIRDSAKLISAVKLEEKEGAAAVNQP